MELITKIILSIFAIAIGIGTYFLYKYLRNKKTTYKGYSYYGEDLLKYKPLFKLNTYDFEECKNACYTNAKCKGITVNPTEELCYGTEEGILRPETGTGIISWIKPEDSAFIAKNELIITNTMLSRIVSKEAIDEPYNRGQFNFSFYIYIDEFTSGSWKHIFHKGTGINSINTNDWNILTERIREQFIGAWLAPYNTTLRIALTNEEKEIEYVDMPNMPINKIVFVSVNVSENTVEIYINSKIVKILTMKHLPRFNYGDLYVKYDNTYKGNLSYLYYTQQFLSVKAIKDLHETSYKDVETAILTNQYENI